MRYLALMLATVALILIHSRCEAVDQATFEAALARWSLKEEAFYKTYQAGQPYPPPLKKRHQPAHKGEDHNTDYPHASTLPESTKVMDAHALKKEVGGTEGPSIGARSRPLPPPPTPAPVYSEETPAEVPQSIGAERKRSFSEVCGDDSSNHCNEANPFNATFCLVSKKSSLTKDCRDYVTAKVNCYLSTAKLCAGEKSHLRCLYKHRYYNAIPRVCSRTQFFDYVRAGVTFKDVLLDQEISRD